MFARDALDPRRPSRVRSDHPAAKRPRPLEKLRAAYFGPEKLATLIVATRADRVVGMVQWSAFYDMFWAMRGARPEWLYVVPPHRGLGTAAALIARVCADARRAGIEYLQGGADADDIAQLYARVAMGSTAHQFHLSAEAFHTFADLDGQSVREIVRGLPARELNKVPPRPR